PATLRGFPGPLHKRTFFKRTAEARRTRRFFGGCRSEHRSPAPQKAFPPRSPRLRGALEAFTACVEGGRGRIGSRPRRRGRRTAATRGSRCRATARTPPASAPPCPFPARRAGRTVVLDRPAATRR